MKKHRKTILVDLDGVLNTYTSDYNAAYIPPAREDTKDFLAKLSEQYTIKLFTSRNKLLTSIWTVENDLSDYISDITNIKEPAWLYIDDRCITFNGNYNELLHDIENFKVWYNN